MKYRITFVHGLFFDYEAASMDDDGLTLTLRDEAGQLVAAYQDSDLASCLPVEMPNEATDGDRFVVSLPAGDEVIHVAGEISGGQNFLKLADSSGRAFACYRNHGFLGIEPA